MAKFGFTGLRSHEIAAKESWFCSGRHSIRPALIGINFIRAFRRKLPIGSTNDSHEFRYLFPLIDLVAARDRMLDAMRHVIPEHFFLDTPERGPDRRDLGNDIDAIAVLLDHPGQTPNLTLDPAEALLTGCLDVFSHGTYIPLQGIGFK